eukprot:c24970_g1_i2 orf=227-1717(+)
MGNARSGQMDGGGVAKELENRLSNVGDLAWLKSAFSCVSTTSSSSGKTVVDSSVLQGCFKLVLPTLRDISNTTRLELFSLTSQVGLALLDVAYDMDKGEVDWTGFLEGFENCCRQNLGAIKLKILLLYFYHLLKRSQVPLTFNITHGGVDFSHDDDFMGYITLDNFKNLLRICWLMMCQSAYRIEDNEDKPLELPDVDPIVRAASMVCSATSNERKEANGLANHITCEEFSVTKLLSWMLSTILGLSDCVPRYFQAQLEELASGMQICHQFLGDKYSIRASVMHAPVECLQRTGLLSPGIAWAISLSQTDDIACKLAMTSFVQNDAFASILYRSTIHGRGMNRFWAQVDGYHGALLILIAVIPTQGEESPSAGEKINVGAILKNGFENKDSYYGSPGNCLFGLSPAFIPLRCTGIMYQVQPKPNGIGFGGDHGKERLWLDEDFIWLTVRHHAMDRTYQPGSIIPNQGYTPIKAKVVEVEVWGLGGEAAKEQQIAFL